jgi:hypothetical protein
VNELHYMTEGYHADQRTLHDWDAIPELRNKRKSQNRIALQLATGTPLNLPWAYLSAYDSLICFFARHNIGSMPDSAVPHTHKFWLLHLVILG